MQTITLNNQAKMPVLGLGTWKSEPDKVAAAVKYALTEAGYRQVDCAAIYLNEAEIGVALAEVFSGGQLKREDVFITSKLWNSKHGAKDVLAACQQTLQDLHLDYLDLYLMHWGIAFPPEETQGIAAAGAETITTPISVRETWEAMEGLVKAGLVRAIGVANFTGPMIIDLLTYAKIKPAMNQIELHPYLQQTDLIKFCQSKGLAVTAYSPLGRAGVMRERNDQPILVDDSKVIRLAEKYQKTPAQILIRWAIQRGTIVIPKSTTPARIKENITVFDFELSGEEMAVIAGLDRKHRFIDAKWWTLAYFD